VIEFSSEFHLNRLHEFRQGTPSWGMEEIAGGMEAMDGRLGW